MQLIGKLTLNPNPTNYFAETEQVAFHTGHLVPGIEVTNDPLMQARLFSYLDTQLTRLGGPNFSQLRSTGRTARSTTCSATACTRARSTPASRHTGPTASTPASPSWPTRRRAPTSRPRGPSRERAVRANPASFDDHFSQATMFYRSLTPLEQGHIVEAFTFELGKCYDQSIKERELSVLAQVDADLCEQVATGLGLPAPRASVAEEPLLSPSLSQIVDVPGPVTGRKVGVIADDGSDLAGIDKLRAAANRLGVTVLVVAPHGGQLQPPRREITVDRTLLTSRSIEFDALIVADGTAPEADIKLVVMMQEAFRHLKTVGAWGSGTAVLEVCGIAADGPGVVVGASVVKTFTDQLVAALGRHRAWDRADAVMASAVPPSR